MRSHFSTLHSLLSTTFWLALIGLSVFALAQVSSDYVNTVYSLQNFFWRVESLTLTDAPQPAARLVIEIQNRSRVVLRVRELELYLQANHVDLGKTYGPFTPHAIQAGESVRLTFELELNADQLRIAQKRTNGQPSWRVLGTYKITTPFAEDDFFYRLNLPIEQRP
jgi:hypothetical protein